MDGWTNMVVPNSLMLFSSSTATEVAEAQHNLVIVVEPFNVVSDPVARLKCLWEYVST